MDGDRLAGVGLDDLRLAAALGHAMLDADLDLCGHGRRWLVSYGRPDATLDPCAFRTLVLTALRGCAVPFLDVEQIAFVGGLREIGGGVFEHHGLDGPERLIATWLPPASVEALLRDAPPEAGDDVEVRVTGDPELGVTVVTLAAAAAQPLRLDALAHWVAGVCLVEELVGVIARHAAR
jgi:hypothetical protein